MNQQTKKLPRKSLRSSKKQNKKVLGNSSENKKANQKTQNLLLQKKDYDILKQSALLALEEKQNIIDALLKKQMLIPQIFDEYQQQKKRFDAKLDEISIEKQEIEQILQMKIKQFQREKLKWSQIYRQCLNQKQQLENQCYLYQQEIDDLKNNLLQITVQRNKLIEQKLIIQNYQNKPISKNNINTQNIPHLSPQKLSNNFKNKKIQNNCLSKISQDQTFLLNESTNINNHSLTNLSLSKQYLNILASNNTSLKQEDNKLGSDYIIYEQDYYQIISNKSSHFQVQNLKNSLTAIYPLDNFSINSKYKNNLDPDKQFTIKYFKYSGQNFHKENLPFQSCHKIFEIVETEEDVCSFDDKNNLIDKIKQNIYWGLTGFVFGGALTWLIIKK